MIRIFQTGDNHIGLKYASREKSKDLSSVRIDAFQNMVKMANDEQCDGVIVFDDPFTDMDAMRMRQACNLVKDFSQWHQVIPNKQKPLQKPVVNSPLSPLAASVHVKRKCIYRNCHEPVMENKELCCTHFQYENYDSK